MALELGRYQWNVGFTTGMGQRPRRRVLRSEQWARLADEITAANRRFGLSADGHVVSCCEAGPDGFWMHRLFCAQTPSFDSLRYKSGARLSEANGH
jgi:transposase